MTKQKSLILDKVNAQIQENIDEFVCYFFASDIYADDENALLFIKNIIQTYPHTIQKLVEKHPVMKLRLKKHHLDKSISQMGVDDFKILFQKDETSQHDLKDIFMEYIKLLSQEFGLPDNNIDSFSLNHPMSAYFKDYLENFLSHYESNSLNAAQLKRVIFELSTKDFFENSQHEFVSLYINNLSQKDYEHIFAHPDLMNVFDYETIQENKALHLSIQEWDALLNDPEVKKQTQHHFSKVWLKRLSQKVMSYQFELPCGAKISLPLSQVAQKLREAILYDPIYIDALKSFLTHSHGVIFMPQKSNEKILGAQHGEFYQKYRYHSEIWNYLLNYDNHYFDKKELDLLADNLVIADKKIDEDDDEIDFPDYVAVVVNELNDLFKQDKQALKNFKILLDRKEGLLFSPKNGLLEKIKQTHLSNLDEIKKMPETSKENMPLDINFISFCDNNYTLGTFFHELTHIINGYKFSNKNLLTNPLKVFVDEALSFSYSFYNYMLIDYKNESDYKKPAFANNDMCVALYKYRYQQVLKWYRCQLQKNKIRAQKNHFLSPQQAERLLNWRLSERNIQRIVTKKFLADITALFLSVGLDKNKNVNNALFDAWIKKRCFNSKNESTIL